MTGAVELANWFDSQHAARQTFVSRADITAGGLALAYDVQQQLVALRTKARGETIAGYKIGVTTPRMQEMVGLDHPVAGAILSGGVRGGPAILKCSDFVRLGLECEVAVRLAKPLDGRNGPLTREAIAASVADVAAAFEIIEDRAADYKVLDMPSLVADNGWNAGMIFGAPRKLIDLADASGSLTINGQPDDSGSTRDVLGHPLNSLAWLCEHLASRGARIEAGHWIMTGTIVPTRFPKPGDVYVFEVDGLPPVEARVV